jgi:hypothetical protein
MQRAEDTPAARQAADMVDEILKGKVSELALPEDERLKLLAEAEKYLAKLSSGV